MQKMSRPGVSVRGQSSCIYKDYPESAKGVLKIKPEDQRELGSQRYKKIECRQASRASGPL